MQQGFQKYIDKQYRKYASQHRQAVALATLFRLGELQGIFALKQESVRETIGGVLFMLLLVCSIFGVPVVFIEKGVHPSGVIITHSVLFLAFLAGGYVLSCSLWMRPPRYLWLYAFADGLAVGPAQSIDQNIIRWSDVTDIHPVWSNRFNPVSEESEPRNCGMWALSSVSRIGASRVHAVLATLHKQPQLYA